MASERAFCGLKEKDTGAGKTSKVLGQELSGEGKA